MINARQTREAKFRMDAGEGIGISRHDQDPGKLARWYQMKAAGQQQGICGSANRLGRLERKRGLVQPRCHQARTTSKPTSGAGVWPTKWQMPEKARHRKLKLSLGKSSWEYCRRRLLEPRCLRLSPWSRPTSGAAVCGQPSERRVARLMFPIQLRSFRNKLIN